MLRVAPLTRSIFILKLSWPQIKLFPIITQGQPNQNELVPCSRPKLPPNKPVTCKKTKHSQQTSTFVCFTLCFFFFLHVKNAPHAKGSQLHVREEFSFLNFHGLKSSSRLSLCWGNQIRMNLFLAQDRSYPLNKLVTCKKTKHSQQTSTFVCFTLCFFFFLHVKNAPHAKGSQLHVREEFSFLNFHGLKSSSRLSLCWGNQIRMNLFLAQDRSYPLISLLHARKLISGSFP